MSEHKNNTPHFYDLTPDQRLDALAAQTNLSTEDLVALKGKAGPSLDQADHMIENVVGMYSLPLGIAQKFVVNNRRVLVPMVVEEPSVVAGTSFLAKLAARGGGFSVRVIFPAC
jgi:hydroxymethylglutaryl-CoA reductase